MTDPQQERAGTGGDGLGHVTRRAVVVGAGLAGLAGLAAGARAAERAPNIIFFLADDLGVSDISCYGAPHIRTPAIDAMAAQGARFTQAYANSAVCTASRVALITGRYQYRLPVGLEEPLTAVNPVGLPPEHPTIPSLLRKAGYSTWLFGKWHMGELPKYGPLQSGYDHFYGFRGGGLDYFSHQLNGKADLWDDEQPIQKTGYLTDLLGARAVEIVKTQARAAKPFFMSVHFNAPHWPWEGPGDEAESRRIGPRSMDLDGGALATYVAMVEAMDRQIGLVLQTLADTGQAQNTIVVFTSDNGGERFSTTWPFSGRKGELLEGGLRVPAVVRWPARIRPGLVSGQMAMSMDWLPTFCAAAGTAPDKDHPTDGMSLLPALVDGAAVQDRKLYWRFKGNAQRAVREGDYKAVKIGPNSFLFDVVNDPMERANLKGRYPDVYKRLTADWDAWNRGMLAERPESQTYDNHGAEWADHPMTPNIDMTKVDDGGPWPS